MSHKVRDLGVFFCFALMLFTVTSCGKEVSDQTIAATEQSSDRKPCSICHGKGVITDDCILCHGAKKCTVCGGSGEV
ncbi:MAG: hypothetical protein ACLSFA_13210 [Roseburia inulinivorans]